MRAPEGSATAFESEGRVLLGATAQQLAAIARAAGAELIVVGGGRRGRVASLLFARVSRILSRYAPCPLVIVPEELDSALGLERPQRAA